MFSGAISGAIMGLVIYLLQDLIGIQLELGIILILFLGGGIYGSLISGLFIGSSTPNVRLKRFQNSIEEGHILLMVDVAQDRVEEVRNIVHQHFPEADDYGEGHTIPAFPKLFTVRKITLIQDSKTSRDFSAGSVAIAHASYPNLSSIINL